MTNIAVLDGRLTDEPEIRETRDGLVIASFSLAVNRSGQNSPTDFIRCKAFRQTAEMARDYLHKGMRILVNGSIQTGSYKDNSGRTVYTTDVVLNRFDFLEKKTEQTTDRAADPVPEFLDVPEEDGMSPFR